MRMQIKQAIRSKVTQVSALLGLSPIRVTGMATSVSIAVAGIGVLAAVIVHPLFWVVAGGGFVGTVSLALVRKIVVASASHRKLNNSPGKITDAQVLGVLRARNGNVTASLLADMTRSTSDAASAKLRSMAVDGRLIVDSDSSENELVYVSSDRTLLGEDD